MSNILVGHECMPEVMHSKSSICMASPAVGCIAANLDMVTSMRLSYRAMSWSLQSANTLKCIWCAEGLVIARQQRRYYCGLRTAVVEQQ